MTWHEVLLTGALNLTPISLYFRWRTSRHNILIWGLVPLRILKPWRAWGPISYGWRKIIKLLKNGWKDCKKLKENIKKIFVEFITCKWFLELDWILIHVFHVHFVSRELWQKVLFIKCYTNWLRWILILLPSSKFVMDSSYLCYLWDTLQQETHRLYTETNFTCVCEGLRSACTVWLA